MEERSLVKNAADPKQVKNGKIAEKDRLRTEEQDLLWLLGHRQGRRIFWKWISKSGPLNTSFGSGNDKTNFNEGKRQLGLWMLDELTKVKPEAYVQMVNEAKLDNYKYTSVNNK